MKISRLKPLLRVLVEGKTRLKRNLLISMVFYDVKACWLTREQTYACFWYNLLIFKVMPSGHAGLPKKYGK